MERARHHNLTRNRYERIAFLYGLMEAPLEYLRFASWRQKISDRISAGRQTAGIYV